MIANCYCGPFFHLRVLGGYNSEGDIGKGEMAVCGYAEPGFWGCHCEGSDVVGIGSIDEKLEEWI